MERFFHHSLFRKVLYFEWALLGICVLGEAVAWKWGPPDPTAPGLLVSLVLIAVVAALSFLAPIEGGYWDRICFLLLETVLLTGAAAAGLPRFVFPLYMVVIAKACLILDSRGIFIIGGVAFVAQIVYASYKIWIVEPQLLQTLGKWQTLFTFFVGSLVVTYGAIVLMVLVAMLTLALVAEQKSRLKSEKLAKEVQDLAIELERTRIAREIHDALGHTLTSLNIQLDVARKFADVDQARSREALELAKEMAIQSLTDVRLAIRSLRDANFNLERALKVLVEEARRTQDLEIGLKVSVPDLSPSVSYQLYRVAQECLTNVLRHAEASQVSIQLEHSSGSLQLSVSDNGRGMTEDYRENGFGIKGMQERVANMNGTVAISAAPEQGTRIQVVIPL